MADIKITWIDPSWIGEVGDTGTFTVVVEVSGVTALIAFTSPNLFTVTAGTDGGGLLNAGTWAGVAALVNASSLVNSLVVSVGGSEVSGGSGGVTQFSLGNTGAGTGAFFSGFGSPPPPPPAPLIPQSVGGGAQYFPRHFNKSFLRASIARIYGQGWVSIRDNPSLSSFFLFPNQDDLCLSREFQLYNLIDREAMSCAKKPECFLQNERDWLDCPPGWRTFNPVKALPLPDPISGDVVLFSFRVPYGYDGVITAQYHGYTLGFTQGAGDIIWRVRADGRYLRDCGDMLLSIGSPKQLSPVYGGLQLRSGNLVEYIVSAPNTSGLLPPPGTGNILAGLHGFFYPRT
jgi:hypothetical protein